MAVEPIVFTYADAVARLRFFTGGAAQDVEQATVRVACQDAYRDIANYGPWNYLYQDYNVPLVAPQNTGTIQYTASNNHLVLTGATWPSWITYGRIRIGGIVYQIDQSVNSTTVTLSIRTQPGADIAAGTSYQVYQSIYSLPADFRRINEPTTYSTWASSYVSLSEWQWLEWHINMQGPPTQWTIGPDPHLPSGLAIYMAPYAPDASSPFAFTYYRSPRTIRYTGYETAARAGTITCNSASVAGGSTAFDSSMVGSILRFGGSAVPTGLGDLTPYTEQRRIQSVQSTTALTLDYAPDGTYSGTKYCITDAVDLPDPLMNAFIALCRYHYATLSRFDSRDDEFKYSQHALRLAREQDALVEIRRTIGGGNKYSDRGWLLPLQGATQP